jgi:hypothetical protein
MTLARNEAGEYTGFPELETGEARAYPPAVLEYMWYVILAYAMLGQAWGVVIPSVGGALLAVLAAACVLTVGAQASQVYAACALALGTGVSVIAVQFFFHSARSFDDSIVFVGWLFTLIIVQALSLRPGFLHRFALAAFAIGLGVLPYMQGRSADGGLVRVSAAGTGISNPNSLAMWFGFCGIYFLFAGIQSRILTKRTIYWFAALGSLYVVSLTVSRGTLMGILLACILGFRSALKRSFYPILSLMLIMWIVYESGVFQQSIDSYLMRGTEETGRGKLWPLALQRLLNSPWLGVGLEDIRMRTSQSIRFANTPHNALLYIGLAGGILPLICFFGYLIQAVVGAFSIMRRGDVVGGSAILPPLVGFALIQTMLADTFFITAWVVVVLGFSGKLISFRKHTEQ